MIRASLVAATVLTATLALPAQADTGFTGHGRSSMRTATDGSTICVRTPASARCSAYQAGLLRTVAKTAGWRPDVSAGDLGRRQLDALIASID